MGDSPYWLGFSALSWGASWGDGIQVDEPLMLAAGGGLRGRTSPSRRVRSGRWNPLAPAAPAVHQRDTDDDVLLLLM